MISFTGPQYRPDQSAQYVYGPNGRFETVIALRKQRYATCKPCGGQVKKQSISEIESGRPGTLSVANHKFSHSFDEMTEGRGCGRHFTPLSNWNAHLEGRVGSRSYIFGYTLSFPSWAAHESRGGIAITQHNTPSNCTLHTCWLPQPLRTQ